MVVVLEPKAQSKTEPQSEKNDGGEDPQIRS